MINQAESAKSTAAEADIDRKSYIKLLIALVIVECVSSLESSMIYTAMKVLYQEFNDPILVGWVITSFVLVNAVTATIGARLGDIYGRRKILAIVIIASGIGSLIGAVSTDVWGVIAGRAVQGLSGPVLALTVGVIRESLPARRVPFAIGLMGATAMISAAVAFLLAGVIIDHLPWRMIFYFSMVYAFLSVIPLMLWVPKSTPAAVKGKLDILGGLLFMPAVAGLLFAIGQIRDWGLLDSRTLGLFALSLIFLALFVTHELRQKHPFIDVRLLGNRQILLANLILVLIGVGVQNSGVILSLLLQQPTQTGAGLGLSGTMTGTLMFVSLMMGMVGGPLAGFMAGNVGCRRPMIIGAAMMLVAWTAMLLNHDSFWWVSAMLLVHGLGQAIIFAGAPILVTECAPADRTSEANGLSQVSRYTSKAAGVQGISFIIGFHTIQTPGVQGSFPTASGYTMLLGLVVVTCALTLIAALCLPRTKGYSQADGVKGVSGI